MHKSNTDTTTTDIEHAFSGLPIVLGFLAFAFVAASAIELRDTQRRVTQMGAVALQRASTDSERIVYRLYAECTATLIPRSSDCVGDARRGALAAGVEPTLANQLLNRLSDSSRPR